MNRIMLFIGLFFCYFSSICQQDFELKILNDNIFVDYEKIRSDTNTNIFNDTINLRVSIVNNNTDTLRLIGKAPAYRVLTTRMKLCTKTDIIPVILADFGFLVQCIDSNNNVIVNNHLSHNITNQYSLKDILLINNIYIESYHKWEKNIVQYIDECNNLEYSRDYDIHQYVGISRNLINVPPRDTVFLRLPIILKDVSEYSPKKLKLYYFFYRCHKNKIWVYEILECLKSFIDIDKLFHGCIESNEVPILIK